jgi:integrase
MPSRIDIRETPRGTRYKAVVTVGSGRGAPRLTRTEHTYEMAQRAVRHLEQVAAGEAPRHDHTVGEVMDGWLAHLERTRQVAPTTLARYRQVCATLSGTRIWRERLAALRPDEIEAALSLGPGSAETKRLRWRVLRAGLRWGARCWHTADPTAGVTMAEARPVKRPRLTPYGLRVLLASVAGRPPLDPFVLLAACTGRRRNEVLALRVRDIDGDVVRVGRRLEWLPGRAWRIRPAGARPSYVRVPSFAAGRLQELVRARSSRPDAFLCSSDGGRTPLSPRDVSLAFRIHADRFGLAGLRVEDLRRSLASVLVEERVARQQVATPRSRLQQSH